MASRGTAETNALKENLDDQMERLVAQLADLEEARADMDTEEYVETKRDTLEQLEEFSASLKRFATGDLTLVDSLNAMQLAIRAAISEAFKTPEVIRMFAKKQPDQLRIRLAQIERDMKMQKLDSDSFVQQKVEILMALKKLGETLQPGEDEFLASNASTSLKEFEKVSSDSKALNDNVLQMASTKYQESLQ